MLFFAPKKELSLSWYQVFFGGMCTGYGLRMLFGSFLHK